MKAVKRVTEPTFQISAPPMIREKRPELQCDNCGHTGPMHEFFSQDECTTCHEAGGVPVIKALDGKRVLRGDNVVQALSKAILGAKGNKKTGHRVSEISDALIDEFGGPSSFARSWYYVIQEAKLRDPGSYSVLRAHEQISKLVLDINKMEGDEQAAQTLDDGKLEEEIVQILLQKIRDGNVDVNAILQDHVAIESDKASEVEGELVAGEIVNDEVVDSEVADEDLSTLSDDELLRMSDVLEEATED